MARRTAPALAAVSPDQVASSQTPNTPAANATENAFAYRRNWRRWGANDHMGAVNLITAQKRAAAAALVKTGRTVSLSRVFSVVSRINTRCGNSF
jgi:hypothetical protein